MKHLIRPNELILGLSLYGIRFLKKIIEKKFMEAYVKFSSSFWMFDDI